MVNEPRWGGRAVGFGLPAGWVVEITDVEHLTPMAAGHLRGVMAWRDEPVGVIDLAAWVGLRPPAADVGRVVVVRAAHGLMSLVAGTGGRLVRKDTPNVVSRRQWDVRTDLLHAVVDFESVSVMIPDLTALTAG